MQKETLEDSDNVSVQQAEKKKKRKRRGHKRWTLPGTKASRREAREKYRNKDNVQKTLLNTLIALSMLTVVNAALSPESPIEWKELPMKASKRTYQVDMVLKILPPCISPNSSLNLRSRRNVSFLPAPRIEEKVGYGRNRWKLKGLTRI